jgi:hypothetical protein
MRALKRFDGALCKARSKFDRFIRLPCFIHTSKAASEGYCVRAGFVSPRSLNYLGYSKASAAERRVGVVRSELDYSTATKEFGVLAWRQ